MIPFGVSMAKDRLSGKLAVILHADVAGSTALVQRDEHLAHERMQDAFHRFKKTIEIYQGRVRELRGDALLAEFERPSDDFSRIDRGVINGPPLLNFISNQRIFLVEKQDAKLFNLFMRHN